MKANLRHLAMTGLFGMAMAGPAAAIPVALELSLVIDVSGSVDTSEYNLQITGYKNAFLNPAVQAGILSFAGSGGIAVNVVQFSTNAQEAIAWRQLTTAGDITNFANDIGAMARLFDGATDVEDGMLAGIDGITNNNFEGTRRVIDVSGDGHQNTDEACDGDPPFNVACVPTQDARDSAAASGIRINGLAIEDGTYGPTGLTTWYNTNVRTSDGFVVTSSNFADFERAVTTKIGREIIDVPAPASLALLGAALAGFGFARRKNA